jgi:hypothetical protein
MLFQIYDPLSFERGEKYFCLSYHTVGTIVVVLVVVDAGGAGQHETTASPWLNGQHLDASHDGFAHVDGCPKVERLLTVNGSRYQGTKYAGE